MISVPAPPRRIRPLTPKSQVYTVIDLTGRERRASEYEYYVALALEKLDLEFRFQVKFQGGRGVKGGFILDFLIFTVPLPTPMWVMGEYWHRGKQRAIDLYQQVKLDSLFRGQMNIAVILFGEDLQTEDQAYRTVKRGLMV